MAVIPPGVPSDGYVKVQWVPTFADAEAPTLTEMNNASALELSCYLTRDGFQPNAEEQISTDERLCSKEITETLGKIKWSIDDLTYIYDAQDPSGLSNEAYAALVERAEGHLVVAWGKDADEAWAVGDIVDVYQVVLGARRKQAPETNSTLKVKQKPHVQTRAAEDVALVA
jgi:hypothetical protein